MNEKNQPVEISIPIIVNCTNSGSILINSPGLGCSKDGDNERYTKIATNLQRLGVTSIIRYQSSLGDFAFKKVNMESLLIDNLRAVVDYALREAHHLCGSETPSLILAGHSAGASTSAAVAFQYSQISKMLLIAPSADIDPTIVRESLSKFSGKLYVILGDEDYVISPEAAQTLASWATKAKSKRVIIIHNCDHNFSGKTNGKILSRAYLWAFDDEQALPFL